MTVSILSDHPLPGKPTSLWLANTPATEFPALQGNIQVDVAIIGGGITGLTAASLLKGAGKTVAVLEARRIVADVTGHTTAKITSLHHLIYAHLLRHFGQAKAQAYADANQAAIELIAGLVQARQIDCDFARTEAYTYTESDAEIGQIEAEVDAALRLGLPASFTTETPLPFPVKAAIRFEHQALFHPRKYLLALVQDLPGDGSYLFEKSRVTSLRDGEPCEVMCEQGMVRAGAVIVASHFPFNDKLLYASRLHPHRSYVLALKLEGPVPKGMLISTEPHHSIRHHPTEDGDLLFVGGEGHKPGHGGDTEVRYRRLEQWARAYFPVLSVEYRWSTQDNRSLDRVPYIGRMSPTSRHVYVATGYGGWGMTNGTVAGMLLRDLILGRENPWAEVYDPNRVKLTGLSELLSQTGDIAVHFAGDRLKAYAADSVAAGEGQVLHTDSGHAAIYKAEDGSVHALAAACTHMGCLVQWNSAEKSWDCPCHGSRFAIDGSVLHGPAIEPLARLAIQPAADQAGSP